MHQATQNEMPFSGMKFKSRASLKPRGDTNPHTNENHGFGKMSSRSPSIDTNHCGVFAPSPHFSREHQLRNLCEGVVLSYHPPVIHGTRPRNTWRVRTRVQQKKAEKKRHSLTYRRPQKLLAYPPPPVIGRQASLPYKTFFDISPPLWSYGYGHA